MTLEEKKAKQLAYERERKAMNDLAMREFDRERAIEALHKEHIETMQKQIDDFYMRYAGSEGLTRAEAMKRADQMDVTKFADKAKRAVKEKDFSPETNEWLKTYNLKMKVSRLELLKEEINWELIQMYDKDYQLISESLREEARLELERQAGILGDSATGASKRIDGIVNSDFYGKNFSERIWDRTGMYQSTQKEVYKSLSRIYTTMDGYRNERNRLMERMGTTEYETMRLLRTETARIGSQVQVEAYKANEFTHFIYVAEPGACDICGPLDGKLFPIEDAQIGLNLKPLHPNCRCSSYGYIAMERLVDGKWVDESTGEEIQKSGNQRNIVAKLNDNIRNKLTDEQVEMLQKTLDIAPDKEKELWATYQENLILNSSKSKSNYFEEMEGVNFNSNFDFTTEKYHRGNIFFHEFGHHLDSMISAKRGEFASGMKLSNGKTFGETIFDDVKKMIDVQDAKKANDKKSLLMKLMSNDYEEKMINMHSISDLYGGSTGNQLSLGSGHQKAYWEPRKTRNFKATAEQKAEYRNTKLGQEGFAMIYSANVNNPSELEMLEKWLPDTFNIYGEVVDLLLKGATK